MEKELFTIIDKETGQELRAQFQGDNLSENEDEIKEKRTEVMDNPYFDFITRTFYNKEI